MYLIYATPARIRLLLKILSSKDDLCVYETKEKEYLFVRGDPLPHIPSELRRQVTIKPFSGRYLPFLKNAGRLNEIMESIEPKVTEGSAVRVTSGRFEGFSGIVREMRGDTCIVEISVFGRILCEEFSKDELQPVEVGI